MSDITFVVGDRVMVLGKFEGMVSDIERDTHNAPAYQVKDNFGNGRGWHHGSDLQRIETPKPLPVEMVGDFVRTTRRRLRVNITRNTKGYSFDHTFEIESDDPELDMAAAMREGLREGDRAAREAIAEAEYTDAHGLPGSDDIDTDAF